MENRIPDLALIKNLIGCENSEVRLWNNIFFQGYSGRLNDFDTKDSPINWYPVNVHLKTFNLESRGIFRIPRAFGRHIYTRCRGLISRICTSGLRQTSRTRGKERRGGEEGHNRVYIHTHTHTRAQTHKYTFLPNTCTLNRARWTNTGYTPIPILQAYSNRVHYTCIYVYQKWSIMSQVSTLVV